MLLQRMFTADQLARFTGAGPPSHSRRIYLAILGSVFDVTDGARHYGKRRASSALLLGWCMVCVHAISSFDELSCQVVAGPTGNYRGAAGKDASKAFVTGGAAHQCMPDMSSKGLQSRSCHHAKSMIEPWPCMACRKLHSRSNR